MIVCKSTYFGMILYCGLMQLKMIIRYQKKIVLLGNTEGSCLENFLLLVAKKFIYYSRSQGTRPKFSEAVNLLKFYRNMENYCEKVFKCKSKMLSKWAIYDIVYNK